jgi:hypothetical protein
MVRIKSKTSGLYFKLRQHERVWQCQDGAPEWYAEIVVEPFGLCLIGVYVSREAAEEAIERTRVSDWSF